MPDTFPEPYHPDVPTDEELYNALTYITLQRVHTTLTIDDFDCIKQDTRYIFYNDGPTNLTVLPLPAIKRTIQRNMKVEDFRARKLVFIPLSSSDDLLVKASTHILDRADQLLFQPQKGVFREIRDEIQQNLEKVFRYEPKKQDIKDACEQIDRIYERKHLWTENFIREILPLANLLVQYREDYFRPLIALSEPIHSKNYTMIHFSVERVREYLQEGWTRFKFNILGGFTFTFAPEIHSGISNHVRIYAPEGLKIKKVEFDISEHERGESTSECEESVSSPEESVSSPEESVSSPEESVSSPEESVSSPEDENVSPCTRLMEYLDENKSNYFDDRCFYIQLGPDKSKMLYLCKKYFNIRFGLSNLLKTLTVLWWLTILSPLIFGALCWFNILPSFVVDVIQSDNYILALFALSATFLVAVGIYAIDKKIVNHFITTHIILINVALIIETLIMIFYESVPGFT